MAYTEHFTPRDFRLTTLPNSEGYHELVLARGIPFTSVCAHRLLHLVGTAHVGSLAGDRIPGLSKLAPGGGDVRARRCIPAPRAH